MQVSCGHIAQAVNLKRTEDLAACHISIAITCCAVSLLTSPAHWTSVFASVQLVVIVISLYRCPWRALLGATV